MTLSLIPLKGFPLIHHGDKLPEIIAAALEKNGLAIKDGDILVLAQKIVSKSEGRLVNLTSVEPSE